MNRLNRDQLAARVAHDIHEGAYVNLGIGLPTLVANHLPKDREILLQSENGLLGMGPAPQPGDEDPDLIIAGKRYFTPGGDLPLERDPQSNRNTELDHDTHEAAPRRVEESLVVE